MATNITLDQANLSTGENEWLKGVVDEFRSSSFLLNNMTFVRNANTVGTNSLITTFEKIKTPRPADFREFNTEYTPVVAETELVSYYLKPMGGSWNIDRVFVGMGDGDAKNLVNLQTRQLVKATVQRLNDAFINGDPTSDSKEFIGLDSTLEGTTTHVEANGLNLSTQTDLEANYKEFMTMVDSAIAQMIVEPDVILVNTTMATKLKAMAREYGLYSNAYDEFGTQWHMYNNIPIVDMKSKSGGVGDVIETDSASGETTMYLVSLDADYNYFASIPNADPLIVTDPFMNEAVVVKTGDVEMVTCPVFRSTQASAKISGIKVSAGTGV